MKPITVVSLCVFGIIALTLILGSFYTVPAGHIGVLLRWGAVTDSVGAGAHGKVPIMDSVVVVPIQTLKSLTQTEASSKDLQVVHTEVALNYHILDAGGVYKNLGMDWEPRVVDPTVKEVLKAVMAKFTAEELITSRAKVSNEIESSLKTTLSPYGLFVEQISLTNFNFSEEFNKAIEAKQTAEQDALRSKNVLEQVKTEAEQKVAKARAEAESLRMQKEQVTDKILRLRWIEKWDGKLPTYAGSGMNMLLGVEK